MNIIQIYDLKTDADIQKLADKLKSAGADIEIYNILSQTDKSAENLKIKRLFDVYGESIFPVTAVNGEIVEVEKYLSNEQIIMQTGISMKKIIKAGIEINTKMCDTNKKCSGCGCSKTSCSLCDKKKNCSRN